MWSLVQHQYFRLWLVFLMLLQAPASHAAAPEPDPEEGRSGIEEVLHRFFGNEALTIDSLDGEGFELVDPYVAFEGKTIEVVIVRQVKSFEDGWDDGRLGAERLLNSFSRRFQDYTQEKIIRQYLLFEAGDVLVPFDLADTERMLRGLPYINDVRIHVVPIHGEVDQVGVVVETNDRWPLGISATVVTADRWRARVYSNNVAGLGIFFSNEVLRSEESEKNWGYRGEVLKRNLGGSFWDAGVDFEDSYRKRSLFLEVSRSLVHPGVNYIGGAQWRDLEELENDHSERAFYQTDVWGGKVIKLFDRFKVGGSARPVLVPAVRVLERDHYKRPVVYPDSNRSFRNFRQFMTSITWQRLKPYKTNYLFGEGEVEDLPTGVMAKTTLVLEDGEFENRPGLFFDSAVLSMSNRGDVAFLGFSVGGFVSENHFSDGILDIHSAYYSQLFGGGRIRHRLYGALEYTLGMGRHSYDRIFLGERSGIYSLENGTVAGNNRLVFKTFYRMFTPWALWGFRMSIFSFADLGVIGDEDASIFKQKFYLSTGLGVRLRNPSLVFPTVQLRLSMVTKVDDPGFRFGVKIGNAPGPDIKLPDIRPGTLAYQ